MPRRYFHRHWIKPHFDSLRSFIKYKNWWASITPEMFGPATLGSERDELPSRLRRHRSDLPHYLSSHLSKPELDLSSHLNRDLNYHLNLNQTPETEHQLDISDR